MVNALAVRNLALACRQLDAQLRPFLDRLRLRRHRRPALSGKRPYPSPGRLWRFKVGGRTLRPGLPRRAPDRAHLRRLRAGRAATRRAAISWSSCCGWRAPGSRSAWWKTTSPRPPTRRCWPRARSIWWKRGHTGVFHVGGGAPISWFHYAQADFRGGAAGTSGGIARRPASANTAPPRIVLNFRRSRMPTWKAWAWPPCRRSRMPCGSTLRRARTCSALLGPDGVVAFAHLHLQILVAPPSISSFRY